MKKYFKVFWIIVVNSIKRDKLVPGAVFANLVGELLEISITIIFFNIIFSNTKTFGDWTFYQTLFLYAYTRTVTSISAAITRGGTKDLANKLIRRGELDFLLTKPLESFLSVLLKRPRPYVILNTLFFIMLGSYSILKGGIQISFAGVCFLIFLTIFSVVLISFLRLLTVIPVFWFIRLWAIQDVLNKFVQFMRYPAKVFALPLRIGLFVVLPVLAASYIPASIFVIGFNWLQALYLMIITYIFVIITKAFWKAGLKKYGSASS